MDITPIVRLHSARWSSASVHAHLGAGRIRELERSCADLLWVVRPSGGPVRRVVVRAVRDGTTGNLAGCWNRSRRLAT